MQKIAKRWLIGGTVQGVGFRYFAQKKASALGVSGWARNLDDGRVEVYGVGAPDRLSEFGAALRAGPRMSEVRSVEEREAAVEKHGSFNIR